ncbi:MAG: acetolactate synthase large subunit, partial [Clostridiales bacterium]|nr:acetolactate synthase large subunit [Clostridiales bacterium]
NCPKSLPDYQILAQSYEAIGILVTKKDEIKGAFQKSKNNKKGPTIIEFMIQKEDNVLPIVAPGIPLDQMLLEL